MGLREIKERARRDLHRVMKVPGYYYAPHSLAALSVDARVHSKIDALGDVRGTSFGYAEKRETVPKLVFLREQIEPKQGGVFIVSTDEGYRLGVADPRDTITRTIIVTELNAKDMANFVAPNQGMVAYGDGMLPAIESAPFIEATGALVSFLPIGG